MKLLFFQYGDFGEAFERFDRGGGETYREQWHSVHYVSDLSAVHDVTVVAVSGRSHREQLGHGLRSVGIKQQDAGSTSFIDDLLTYLTPDAVICRTPNIPVLKWAAAHKIPTLPCFADMFTFDRPWSWFNSMRLRRILRSKCFPCVANHSLSATKSLVSTLGISADRAIPWDWKKLEPNSKPKAAPDGDLFNIFYAGALIKKKGVGDLIEAVGVLKKRGRHVHLSLAGQGDLEAWSVLARQHNCENKVQFLGLIPSVDVNRLMAENDCIVVPSRHDYEEGLPNTIYEACKARTPLVISDHPAFSTRVVPGKNVLVFKEKNPSDLADQIECLIKDGELYEKLSENSAALLDSLYFGIDWFRLISFFLEDPENKTSWVQLFSLKRHLEDGKPANRVVPSSSQPGLAE